ncbi:hypothetical protein E8E13_007413 [Curvularia kusanoi]|uniref:CENP-V/GFA domain-containing protein n=1 Tax=Curvularia kusanoi TaxID=90978 RepID=A0A9P4T9I0_CURKU|nr:hypothetical protein E8E13_007413 [Curvularia kusanoi]
MPLPDEALRIEGGCNCNAVRYRVDIPTKDERPLHPLAPAESPVSMPFLALDHCNDCRRATASILPAWLCAPLDMCSVSLVATSSASLAPNAAVRKEQAKEQSSQWIPAADAFIPTAAATATEDCFLTSYESSHQRWRWFCVRCGTNVAYTAAMPAGFPSMLDITLGSVDRHYLDSEALIPERHLWWDYGIDWIHRLATEGYGKLPIHPNYRIAEIVDTQQET